MTYNLKLFDIVESDDRGQRYRYTRVWKNFFSYVMTLPDYTNTTLDNELAKSNASYATNMQYIKFATREDATEFVLKWS